MGKDRPYRPAPEFQRALDDLERLGNPLDRMARDNVGDLWLLRELMAAQVLGPVPLGSVRDSCVPARNRQIPVRVYLPPGPRRAGGRPPVLVYYHGGGWALGSVATSDSLCRALTRGSGLLVVSVDYRLAPEHPFPAALADAHLALEWVARNAGDGHLPWETDCSPRRRLRRLGGPLQQGVKALLVSGALELVVRRPAVVHHSAIVVEAQHRLGGRSRPARPRAGR
jgi:hypothetical protein